MTRLSIIGAGGFGREVHQLLTEIDPERRQFDLAGFYDDTVRKNGIVQGLPVCGPVEKASGAVVVAIGEPAVRRKVVERLARQGCTFPNVIHPDCRFFSGFGNSAKDGIIMTAGIQTTVNITLGRSVIINLGCTIGHDVNIADFVSLMPGVHISGEVSIGEDTYIGTGAVVLNGLSIGRRAVVGAGAVVTRNVPDGFTVAGVPARPLTR